MKLKQMTARFGRLDGDQLTLGPGLNIIHAPNEGGKSTWAGFLKAMLYGIDTRDRDKKGHLADKNRYQPWSGAPMEGELTLEWQGREITLRRGRQGSQPFGAFSAVYTGTDEPVPGLTGENCGELLTGISREVFERSAFIGQSGVAIQSVPELEKRIAALVSSGEEDVSYSQTEARLKEWLNRRKVNKTVGLIPKLEGELAENDRTLARLEQLAGEISRDEEERVRLEQAKTLLLDQRSAHRAAVQRDLDRRFTQAQEDLDGAQQALDALRRDLGRFGALPQRELLKRAQGELQYLKVLDEEIKEGDGAQKAAEEAYVQANIAIQDPLFNGMTGQEAVHKTEEDQRSYQELTEQGARKKKQSVLLLAAGLLTAALGAAATFAVPALSGNYVPLGVGLGVGLLGLGGWLAAMQRAKSCAREGEKLLARYGAQDPAQLGRLSADYERRWQAAEEKAEALKQIRGALNDRQARRENTHRDLLDFVHTFAPEVRDLFGCSAAVSRALGLEDRMRESSEKLELTRRRRDDLAAQGGRLLEGDGQIQVPGISPAEVEARLAAVEGELERLNRDLDMARGEQKAVGDPAALAARQEELRSQLDRRETEYRALSAAMTALKAANARLQERFSPELNRLAGQWMDRLTGGRYTSVSLNRELEASATQSGALLPRKALALSQGTADQLYLAVRLAVCQLCLPAQEPAPLVLDDALVSFDDRRMALALDQLDQLGGERQVLLFTCQDREGRAMEGRPQVTRVELA